MIECNMTLTRTGFSAHYFGIIPSGITGVFGPSGSGKTTLLHLLCGLTKPDTGYLKIADEEIVNTSKNIFTPAYKRKVGVVFQDFRLFPHMSVEKNLKYGCKEKNNRDSFLKVVEMLELNSLLQKMPNQLSGGQKQRVGLGRALLMDPEILVLDEPFSALDAGLRFQLLPYIKKIQKEKNIPILVVSHELPDLLKLTTNLAIIKDGSILGIDSVYNLARKQNIYNILKFNHITNNFTIVVDSITQFGDYQCLLQKNEKGFKSKINSSVQIAPPYDGDIIAIGSTIEVAISPSAISISKTKICGISTVNQLQGILREFLDNGKNILCIVDIGVEIFIEISYEAFHNLQISDCKGMIIYALFKASSIGID